MKKIISTAFVGAIGGACVLIANHFLLTPNTSQAANYNPYKAPVQLTSYSGALSSTPDFIAYSGYIAYIENRVSVQRSKDGIEQFKFVLGF